MGKTNSSSQTEEPVTRKRLIHDYVNMPKCPDFTSTETNVEIMKNELQIKHIKLKASFPKVMKDVMNNKHNLFLIQHELYRNNHSVTPYYKISDRAILDSWLKLIMLHHLEHHVYARLAKGEFGVAIQAIRDIPKGTYVFENTSGICHLYHPVKIKDHEVNDDAIKTLLNDFYLSFTSDSIEYPIPILGPNMIDMSFFLNHDDPGNIKIDISKASDHCDMSSYIAARDIQKDEFLTINYAQFAQNNSDRRKLLERMPFLKNLSPFKNGF